MESYDSKQFEIELQLPDTIKIKKDLTREFEKIAKEVFQRLKETDEKKLQILMKFLLQYGSSSDIFTILVDNHSDKSFVKSCLKELLILNLNKERPFDLLDYLFGYASRQEKKVDSLLIGVIQSLPEDHKKLYFSALHNECLSEFHSDAIERTANLEKALRQGGFDLDDYPPLSRTTFAEACGNLKKMEYIYPTFW